MTNYKAKHYDPNLVTIETSLQSVMFSLFTIPVKLSYILTYQGTKCEEKINFFCVTIGIDLMILNVSACGMLFHSSWKACWSSARVVGVCDLRQTRIFHSSPMSLMRFKSGDVLLLDKCHMSTLVKDYFHGLNMHLIARDSLESNSWLRSLFNHKGNSTVTRQQITVLKLISPFSLKCQIIYIVL